MLRSLLLVLHLSSSRAAPDAVAAAAAAAVVAAAAVPDNDAETAEAEEADEFAAVFRGERTPKLFITTSK